MKRLLVLTILGASCFAQIDGAAAYRAFREWQALPSNSSLKWEEALDRYRAKLAKEGVAPKLIQPTLDIIAARDEAVLYDPAYQKATDFQTKPSALVIEAVRNRKPGRALDVGTGMGRNAIYLAQQGWSVTGFDVAATGLAKARERAASLGVKIDTQHKSDLEFDFGTNRWDLIVIVHAIEKRSVFKVREALKRGGLVVIEESLKGKDGAPFEYESKELLRIFQGFRIVKYEEKVADHEWAQKKLPMVFLIAEKL